MRFHGPGGIQSQFVRMMGSGLVKFGANPDIYQYERTRVMDANR